jgi:glyoxylase-like metal-dependent hydrolase (beta-lactamase superfamily II)
MRGIDCRHLGREHVICCWQVGDVLIDPGPGSCLETLLEALDGREPKALLLTHIHLDHAGASGSLARRFPDLQVFVHERGARHMV